MQSAFTQRVVSAMVILIMASVFLLAYSTNLSAQEGSTQENDAPAIVESDEIQSILSDQPEPEPAAATPSGIDLLTLIMRGGAFMIPIIVMSLFVVGLAVERLLSLRRSKIMPAGLKQDLETLARPIDRFNPGVALRSCYESPSPLANVVMSMLRRTGEPLADVERAATESVQREVDRHASPIRWLTLAAAATPLMGLLGTVWGMIVAFHESTTLTADRSRSEQLSEGIYTALVTTLAGLAVAIPAAILALYLENRLLKLFHRVQETAFEIAPGLSRFAGNSRLDDAGNLTPISGSPNGLGQSNVTPANSSPGVGTASAVANSHSPPVPPPPPPPGNPPQDQTGRSKAKTR